MQSRHPSRALAVAGASLLALGVWAFSGPQQNNEPQALAAVKSPASGTVSHQSRLASTAAPASSAFGADPLQVEPRVPRAAGTPCVVEIARDRQIWELWNRHPRTYTPPTACPGPYAKIKLVVELTGPREFNQPSSNIQLFLGTDVLGTDEPSLTTGALFAGAPQITDDIGLWRMERDVTEYAAALFGESLNSYFSPGVFENWYTGQDEFLQPFVRSAKLIFFPATAATPAQRVADVVLPLPNPDALYAMSAVTTIFPRNIERAYVDVIAKPRASRFWYACAPQQSWEAFPILRNGFAIGDSGGIGTLQGCGGGSFREVEILVDGQLAGLAPVFPWLPSNISNMFRSAIDSPAPSVQALNMMPFRVDITPFAGMLNDGVEHTVEARMAGGDRGFVSGHVLLYLDQGSAVVPGAVTRNTLAGQPAAPVVTNTLTQTYDDPPYAFHLTGQVDTRSTRAFRIDGYVDTSRGRITSTVIQRNHFVNTLTYDVTGYNTPNPFGDYDTDFLQKVRLSSTVDLTARRMLGAVRLSEDKLYSTYPLIIDYHHDGYNHCDIDCEFGGGLPDIATNLFTLRIHQARGKRTSQLRRGTPWYRTSLKDIFNGSHDYFSPALGGVGDTNWWSRRSYLFTDNRTGCYSAGLTTANRVQTGRTRGEDCPNGKNALRWYSHPDGSPDSMGWAPGP